MSELGDDIEALRRDPTSSEAASRVRSAARAAREDDALFTYAEAFAERGRRLAADGHRDGAIQSFLEAAQVFEDELEALDDAATAYRAVLELDPAHRRAMFGLGLVLHELERFDELVALYRRRLEHAVDDGERTTVYLYLAEILADQLGDVVGGFEAVVRAAQLSPHNLRIIGRLESLGERTERHAEVAVVLGDLLMNQEDPRVRAALSVRLAELHMGPLSDEARALAYYRAALADDGGNPRTLARVEDVFRERARFDALADLLDEVARDRRVGRQRIRLERELARLLEHELGDKRRALAVLARAVREAPDDRDLIDEVLRLGTAAGALDVVAEVIEDVAERSANALLRTYLRLKLGHILAVLLDRPRDAMRAYEAVLAEDPHHKEARRRVEALAEKTGDWARLAALAEDALTAPPPRRTWAGEELTDEAAPVLRSVPPPPRAATPVPTGRATTPPSGASRADLGDDELDVVDERPATAPRVVVELPLSSTSATQLGVFARLVAERPPSSSRAQRIVEALESIDDADVLAAVVERAAAEEAEDAAAPRSSRAEAPASDAPRPSSSPPDDPLAALEALVEAAIEEGELERAFFAQVRVFRARPSLIVFQRIAELARRAELGATLARLAPELLSALDARSAFQAELTLAEVEAPADGEARLLARLERDGDDPLRELELRGRLARLLGGLRRAEQHLRRAELLEQLGHGLDEVGVELALAVAEAPRFADAVAALARHRERVGDDASALDLVEQQAELTEAPRARAALWAKAAALADARGDRARVERACRALLAADPDDLRAEAMLGEACLARDDAEAALPHLTRAARGLAPVDPPRAAALERLVVRAARTIDRAAEARAALEALDARGEATATERLALVAHLVDARELARARLVLGSLERRLDAASDEPVTGAAAEDEAQRLAAACSLAAARIELVAGDPDACRRAILRAREAGAGRDETEPILAELDEAASRADVDAIEPARAAASRWLALGRPARALTALAWLRTRGRPDDEVEADAAARAALDGDAPLEPAWAAWRAVLSRDPARVDALERLARLAARSNKPAWRAWCAGLVAGLEVLDPTRGAALRGRLEGCAEVALPLALSPAAAPLARRLDRFARRFGALDATALAPLGRWPLPKGARPVALAEVPEPWRSIVDEAPEAWPTKLASPPLYVSAEPLGPDTLWRLAQVEGTIAIVLSRAPASRGRLVSAWAAARTAAAPGVAPWSLVEPLSLRGLLEGLAEPGEGGRGEARDTRRRVRAFERTVAPEVVARVRDAARLWAADPERPSALSERRAAVALGDLAVFTWTGLLPRALTYLAEDGVPLERRVEVFAAAARLHDAELAEAP